MTNTTSGTVSQKTPPDIVFVNSYTETNKLTISKKGLDGTLLPSLSNSSWRISGRFHRRHTYSPLKIATYPQTCVSQKPLELSPQPRPDQKQHRPTFPTSDPREASSLRVPRSRLVSGSLAESSRASRCAGNVRETHQPKIWKDTTSTDAN